MNNPRHILRAEQFNQDGLLDHLIERADHYSDVQNGPEVRTKYMAEHAGKVLFSVFYEPSTRTSFSFRSAATRLGMAVIGTEAAGQFSSAVKGETLEDTTRMLVGNQPDVILLRHPDDGAAERMAALCEDTPVINGGDGRNEHPTQALLDVYTIQKEFGHRDNLRIVIGGDIAGGRTAKSLLNLLGVHRNNSFLLVAPEACNADQTMQAKCAEMPATVDFSYNLDTETLRDADVVYWTRAQTERGSSQQDSKFILQPSVLEHMNPEGIIMHPLPRVTEIPITIDSDPRAHYFQQAANGLPTRMALLDWVLTNQRDEIWHTMSGLLNNEIIRVSGLTKAKGVSSKEQYAQMKARFKAVCELTVGRKVTDDEVSVQNYWKQGDRGPIE